jgi:hypothetical protein
MTLTGGILTTLLTPQHQLSSLHQSHYDKNLELAIGLAPQLLPKN